jgi:Tfp pilus assembly protein PilO
MNEHEWQEAIGTIGVFVLLITVVLTVLWQMGSSRRAKALLARESEYRELAQAAVTGQQGIERQLAEIRGQVSDLRSRTDSVERILKDVE